MEVSYDSLKQMIADVFQEMKAAEKNELIDQHDLAQGKEQTTRQYCMKLVAPEMRKSFINQLNQIELATKGNLNKESTELKASPTDFVQWARKNYPEGRFIKDSKKCVGEDCPEQGLMSTRKKSINKIPIRVARNTTKKIPVLEKQEGERLTKKILVKIINDVLEEEVPHPTTGEITKRREALFPSWKTFRQLSKGIVSPNEAKDKKKKKKGKKNCSKGAIYHDSDGKWTNKQNAKVYSLKFAGKGKKDCKRGQARVVGGSERFLKLPCGRKDVDGTEKEPYKCKDGSPVDSE